MNVISMNDFKKRKVLNDDLNNNDGMIGIDLYVDEFQISALNFIDIYQGFPHENILFKIGHSIDQGFAMYSFLREKEKSFEINFSNNYLLESLDSDDCWGLEVLGLPFPKSYFNSVNEEFEVLKIQDTALYLLDLYVDSFLKWVNGTQDLIQFNSFKEARFIGMKNNNSRLVQILNDLNSKDENEKLFIMGAKCDELDYKIGIGA